MPVLNRVNASDEFGTPEDGSAGEDPRVTQLLQEAQVLLFQQDHPIDARAKLLEALNLAPRDYRPHELLGVYYLVNVGNFQLAHRYLITAEAFFKEKFGPDERAAVDPRTKQEHASLLKFLTESYTNLDDYNGALQVLDRYSKYHMSDWYSGARSWVLFKLKRIDDGIRVAQAGLLRGDDLGRTFNILGILLSVKGQRGLALDAFARSAKFELAFGLGEAATPLNNAGEVYREMFSDNRAETAWRKALQLPDGCEHILPSLNLAILYIDQLRLLQAERILNDFEGCYAKHSIRTDTEHRALLALARGRIALHKGEFEKALSNLTLASERQQWFGKIGTDQADLRFAALSGMSEALKAYRNVLKDRFSGTFTGAAGQFVERALLQWRIFWLKRRALETAIDELNDMEDLHLRNTDSMLEYPTLGGTLAALPEKVLRRRLARLEKEDDRPEAQVHYRLYYAENLLAHGSAGEAAPIFEKTAGELREIDRLARAQSLGGLIATRNAQSGWFSSGEAEVEETNRLTEQLFDLLPSEVRARGLLLPVSVDPGLNSPLGERIGRKLTGVRFAGAGGNQGEPRRYQILIRANREEGAETVNTSLVLLDRNIQLVALKDEVKPDSPEENDLLNRFVDEAFRWRGDPPGEPLVELDLLDEK
jgi:tetratricopeptide (TPR) repeat protein